jgi:hypothetical protein
MSLSARDKQALASIGQALSKADPALAGRLACFGSTVSGEPMPACERLGDRLRHRARRTLFLLFRRPSS